jgi:transposase
MDMHVGLDVSQRTTSICIIDASGQRTWQGTAPTEPAAIVHTLNRPGFCRGSIV